MVHRNDPGHLGKSQKGFHGKCGLRLQVCRPDFGHGGSTRRLNCQYAHSDCVQFLLSNAQQEVYQSDLEW